MALYFDPTLNRQTMYRFLLFHKARLQFNKHSFTETSKNDNFLLMVVLWKPMMVMVVVEESYLGGATHDLKTPKCKRV